MNNEQMNGKVCTIKELEDVLTNNTFMRNLTADEINIILDNGLNYFIHETLGMSDEEFEGFKKIKRIISAYCTKSQEDFDRELNNDIEIPYYALKTIVNALEERMKDKACKETITTTTKESVDETESKAAELCNLLNKIPNSADNWMRCYVKYVKYHSQVLDAMKKDSMNETEDQKVGNILDAIKDSVIDACIEKLKTDGEIELDPEIMSEVTSKLWHTEDNIRINITNNKLKVEFK